MIWLWVSLGIVGGVLLITLLSVMGNNLISTTRYTLEIEGLEKNIKIVQVSDLHGKAFGKNNCRLIEKILNEKPDFIAVTGDIIHRYSERNKKVALRLVSSLIEIAPVLYIAGNHELRNKGYRFFRRDLIEAGAQVLDDCPLNICDLTVVGLKCSSLKNDKIFSVTPKDDGVKILLAHMPQFIERYAEAGYDLVLCGHAHGGQWRIPFTHRGIYAPGQGLFPKYTEGVHTCGKTKMVISRGLGNSEFPVRLFNHPELITINLIPRK